MTHSRLVIAGLVSASVLLGTIASADEGVPVASAGASVTPARPPQLVWNDAWSRVGVADYVVTGSAIAVALAGAIVPPLSHHLYGGVLFDESARNVLRLSSVNGRYAARDASDVLLSLETTYPFFIDALVIAYGAKKSPAVAYQMTVIDVEALSIATALQGVTSLPS